ncbi:MAG: POTRA domain-containing protein, partial [Myxococcota bacterium]
MTTISPRHARPAPRLTLAALALLTTAGALGTGCKSARIGERVEDFFAFEDKERTRYTPPGMTDQLVAEVRLVGVRSVDKAALRATLANREDEGWRARISYVPIIGVEPRYFNAYEWEKENDLVRIQRFYEERGFFDVTVSQSLNRNDDGEPILSFRVDEGAPTLVDSIRFVGLQGTGVTPQTLQRSMQLKRGDVFTLRDYDKGSAATLATLRARSYAYAEVSGRVVVTKSKQTAAITYFVDPGPRAKVGSITITGLGEVKEAYVREVFTFKTGERFDATELQRTQEAIYNLGVFSLVVLQPDYLSNAQAALDVDAAIEQSATQEVPGPLGVSRLIERARAYAQARIELDPVVPVSLQLKEAQRYGARVGAGIALDTQEQDIHAIATFTARNIANRLGTLQSINEVGYTWAPGGNNSFEEAARNLVTRELTTGNRGVHFNSQL